jgi:hypothetical protein
LLAIYYLKVEVLLGGFEIEAGILRCASVSVDELDSVLFGDVVEGWLSH